LVASHGYSAGNDLNANPVYIGKGDNSAYLGMASCPAQISINPVKPGAYRMSTATSETFNDKNAFFLANHPNIVWGLVNASTAWNHPHAIRMMSGNYPVMQARVNVSGMTFVGRVWK
jgi:hypothetical protein